MGRRLPKDLPRWRVTRIVGNRARELCELEAATADAAVKRAIREFGIDAERAKRLAAYRVMSR
jgi:hypothetical protein